MKTTLEIPDPVFRQVKSHAAARGQSRKEFVAQALQARLVAATEDAPAAEPKWMLSRNPHFDLVPLLRRQGW